MDEKVSIITPCYNGEKFVAETIGSVLAQTYQDWEMLIVNDGSKDNTEAVIAEYLKRDPRIKYFYQENAGAAAARNNGIRNATGRYIALLDSDDVWYPEFLEKQIAFMNQNNTICVCASYDKMNENSEKIGKPIMAKKRIRVKDMMITNRIGCLTGLYDSSKFGKMYLDESLKSVRDDYAYWLEIVKLAGCAYGNQEVLACYRMFKQSVTGNKFKLVKKHYHFYRSYLKLGPVRSFWNLCIWGINGIIKFRDFYV